MDTSDLPVPLRPLAVARRLAALVALVFVGLVATAGPALAQVAPDGNVSPDAPAGSYLTVNNTLVLVLTGAVIPLVNGLLLRATNPAWVKGLVSSLFAVAVHDFSQMIQDDGTALLSQEWCLGLAITLISMTAAYLQVWKPLVNPNASLPTVVPIGDLVGGSPQRRPA